MLDPYSALGAAASIVQFVDVASRLIASGYDAYTSASGAIEENVQIETTTLELKAFSDNLLAQNRGRSSQDDDLRDQETKNMIKMTERCVALADRLLKVLHDLKVEGTGPMRSLSAVRQAVRAASKSKKIESMEDSLMKVQSLLQSHLLSSIRSTQVSLSNSFEVLAAKTEAMQKENIADLRASNQALIQALQRQETDMETFRGILRNSQLPQVHSSSQIDTRMGEITRALDRTRERANIVEKQLHILGSLQFPEMHMRHSAIPDAYRGTLAWIYDEKASKFRSWLQGSDGLFWINGKAGSGKSTLMKYMSDNKTTRDVLEAWAGKKKTLVTASFYFWNAGFPMQKSQQGLIQSLLFQIMRKFPDLIPQAVPQRWAAGETFYQHPDPWSQRELSDALTFILSHNDMNARFCFFIDGLDEYTGDHYELVQYLQLLVESKAVKLCVSSRPWNAFTSAFGDLEDRTLVLQNLTRADMRGYVQGMLEQDARFLKLVKTDDRAHELATEIQERAQGVFLWVFLVVRSLLRGLTEQDDIPMLQKRLRQLPTDLEHYFQLILDSVDTVYQEYTARTLLIVFEASQPLSMLAFWYLETDLEKPDFVLKLDIKPLPDESVTQCRTIVAARLNKWCRDLLEVIWSPTAGSFGDMAQLFKVDFLHRTVRDFLMTRNIQDTLIERAGSEFNASLTTCRLYLALAKWLNPALHDDALLPFHRICGVIMRSAATYEFRYNDTPFLLLEELKRVGEHYRRWGAPWCMDDLDGSSTRSSTDFLSLAERYGLKLYVKLAKAQQGIDDDPEPQARAGVTMFSQSSLMPPSMTDRTSTSSRRSSTLCLSDAAVSDGPSGRLDDEAHNDEKRRSWRKKFKKLLHS
ncbi:hypothetical protein PRZ48_014528 [Zasmidium cellare]|uniref:NACHT domain-containing protein n=1 Tax=Zasmidium cellare TaxID=395010 RepID=A0ABR0DZ02_ZASCE|nr:hypothetical protein PRZ48_014528 [Zasmidium cellare]